MQLITDKIAVAELKEMSEKMFNNLVKAVVDIKRKVMVVDAEMHSDQEEFLLENGSEQQDLWGINLYPQEVGDEFIEFDSMINVRPKQENRSRYVHDPKIREEIIKIVHALVQK